ncbi:hypothetical protein O988_04877, partial [Pseudogymnoascus sp. VKM F-3808]
MQYGREARSEAIYKYISHDHNFALNHRASLPRRSYAQSSSTRPQVHLKPPNCATTHPPPSRAHQPSPTYPPPFVVIMSLVNLANVCSHLQNASRARLGLTSVPASNMILGLSLSLQQSGFLRSVTRGGAQPPPVDALSTYVPEPVTQENVASRRLWLGLKYWDNSPVLTQMAM